MNIIPLYNTKQLLPGLNASPEVVWVRFGRHKLFYLIFKEYIHCCRKTGTCPIKDPGSPKDFEIYVFSYYKLYEEIIRK